MKKILCLVLLVGCSASFLIGQAATQKTTYQMFNNSFMKPKRGHEKQFEEGVKAHNAAYHSSGPHRATLSMITEGSGSDGWYIWSMGPLMYKDLDHQPDGNVKHDEDWDKNVDAHVEEYGESYLWKLNEELSYTPANYNPQRIDVWVLDIKPGMRYQFADLMKKMKAVWDAKKYSFSLRVFYNDLWNGKGKDAAIVYSFDNYAEFDLDVKFKEDFEAIHGAGSYDNFWKSWNDCVASVDEHMRKFIK
jgi:hypothetical protein